jgi:hypothetical protein
MYVEQNGRFGIGVNLSEAETMVGKQIQPARDRGLRGAEHCGPRLLCDVLSKTAPPLLSRVPPQGERMVHRDPATQPCLSVQ